VLGIPTELWIGAGITLLVSAILIAAMMIWARSLNR
jgi:hypothetical protein